MEARLFAIPASHPSVAAELMLQHKGIAYRRTDLPPVISRGVLRGLGFAGSTVPALKLNGERIQGSRRIARELERLHPEPPLFPADPRRRVRVEEAECFGEEELQDPVREILWMAIRREPRRLRSYLEGAKLGVPQGLAVSAMHALLAAGARLEAPNDETARRTLAALPPLLDRVDRWIEMGVLGGEQPNAADLQIAPSLCLAMTLDDLRPLIECRHCGALAKRIVPSYPGHTPSIFPAAWLEAPDSGTGTNTQRVGPW